MDEDSSAEFLQLVQGVGGLVFFALLVVVAIQYRRRLREVRRLKDVNGMLSTQLAAAVARIEEMERWRRPSA